MLLHVLLAVVIPNVKFDNVKIPEVLEVELVTKPEPPPALQPEPIQPQPEQPKPKQIKPKIEPKPIVKSLPTPAVVKNDPVPHQSPPTTQTEVIAVAPRPEAPPSPVPPAPIVIPEPPKPAAPSQVDIDDARGRYGNTLWGAIEKHKSYPKIAQMRGWQGKVVVELQLDGNGKLKSKKILKGSGYDILDKQALDMIEKAAPFPAPPEALRVSSFSITVPIPFKLE